MIESLRNQICRSVKLTIWDTYKRKVKALLAKYLEEEKKVKKEKK